MCALFECIILMLRPNWKWSNVHSTSNADDFRSNVVWMNAIHANKHVHVIYKCVYVVNEFKDFLHSYTLQHRELRMERNERNCLQQGTFYHKWLRQPVYKLYVSNDVTSNSPNTISCAYAIASVSARATNANYVIGIRSSNLLRNFEMLHILFRVTCALLISFSYFWGFFHIIFLFLLLRKMSFFAQTMTCRSIFWHWLDFLLHFHP